MATLKVRRKFSASKLYLSLIMLFVSVTICNPVARATEKSNGACDTDLLYTAPDHSFAYKLRGSICEGLIAQPISGSFSVVSYFVGRPSYSETPIPIEAKIGKLAEVVDIRGVARLLGIPYRLDARIGADRRFNWKYAAIAKPLTLRPQDVGFFATTVIDASRVFVPVQVGSTVQEAAQKRATISVRASEDLGPVEFRMLNVSTSQPIAPWTPATQRAPNQGEILEIDLPEVPAGVYRVELRAQTDQSPPQDVFFSELFYVGE